MNPTFLLDLHSVTRWVIVGIGVLAVVWYLLRWRSVIANLRLDRALMMVFTVAMDIQVALGILHLLEWFGAGMTPQRAQYEHLGLMIVVTLAVHFVSARFKKADQAIRARNYGLVVLAALILIFVGVVVLPAVAGVNRWGMPV
ncbi:MAG: hypothetical protein IT323_01140 [Anaerolineae bacterium]|nr:hypothetical protein [Anaerolineae bacterium]